MHSVTEGLPAGASGTLALDPAPYGDMPLRGRGSSGMPAQVTERLADRAGVPLGEDEERSNRTQAAGALLGCTTGLGTGVVYGLLRHRRVPLPNWVAGPVLGAAAMAGGDVPATALRVTDPTSWDPKSWLSDVVPHPVHGLTTASVYRALRRAGGSRGQGRP